MCARPCDVGIYFSRDLIDDHSRPQSQRCIESMHGKEMRLMLTFLVTV